MIDQAEGCLAETSRIEKSIRRFNRWSWWYTMPIASFIHEHTRRHLEPPMSNKFLAGLAEACWVHCCGHGIKYAFHVGMIFWSPKKSGKSAGKEG